MKRYILLFILSTIVGQTILLSQSAVLCGSQVTNAQVTLEKSFTIPQVTSLQSLPQLNRTLSIMVYVVQNNPSNTAGTKIITPAMVQTVIDNLKPYFSPVSLSFKLLGVQTVANYQFDDLTQGDGKEGVLTKSNQTLNCINIYLANNLYDTFSSDISGYTYMPADNSNNILIRKSFFTQIFLAHQLGHFLGLYHTHESIFGNEAVSRTGLCDLTGDRCCDTEADPNVSGWIANCLYNGTLKDGDNAYYHPSVKNIMSYGDDNCQCNFSAMQYMRMVYTLNKFRKILF